MMILFSAAHDNGLSALVVGLALHTLSSRSTQHGSSKRRDKKIREREKEIETSRITRAEKDGFFK